MSNWYGKLKKMAALPSDWWRQYENHFRQTLSLLFKPTRYNAMNAGPEPMYNPQGVSTGNSGGNQPYMSFQLFAHGRFYNCDIWLELDVNGEQYTAEEARQPVPGGANNWDKWYGGRVLKNETTRLIGGSWTVERGGERFKPFAQGQLFPEDSSPYDMLNKIKQAVASDPGPDDDDDDDQPEDPVEPPSNVPGKALQLAR